VDVALTAFPVKDGLARVVGAAMIGRDITTRLQVERDIKTAHDAAVDACVRSRTSWPP
jgi:predicted RNA polymerase sigma factor